MIDWNRPYAKVYGKIGVAFEQDGKFYRGDGHPYGYVEPEPEPEPVEEKKEEKVTIPPFIHDKPVRKKFPSQMTRGDCMKELAAKEIKFSQKASRKELRKMVAEARRKE